MLTPLLSPLFDAIPPELRDMPQSVCWRLENRPGEDKPTKVPYNPHTSGKAMADQPGTWADFDTARGVYERSQKTNRPYSGIGFQLGTQGGPFFAVDLDKCIDPETGEVAEWAQEIVEALRTYWERSPSGTGLRAIGRGTLPEGGRNRKGPIEIYDRLRYITLTGRVFGERMPIADCSRVLPGLHLRLFPPAPKPAPAPRPAAPLSLSDTDLIDKATAAANGAAFSALWRGDTSAYHGDDSAADLALCGTLAFWAQGDEHRIDALFRQSGLYREKWERADYRARTIGKALSGKTDFYEPAAPRELGRQGYGTSLPQLARARAVEAPGAAPSGTEDAPEWETPVPFTTHNLSSFPVEALPPVLGAITEEEAASSKVPVDMAAMLTLSVVGAAGGRRCRVQVGTTHAEPLNLWCAVVMEPGSRKSAVMALTAPLREYEAGLIQAAKAEQGAAKARRAIEDKRLSLLQEAAAKDKSASRRAELTREAEELAAELTEVPALPRLLIDDITPEKVPGFMAENAGAIALFSPEGGIFVNLTGGRSSKGELNIDAFLKGHAGDEIRVDRVGRPPEYVKRPALSMGLLIQPDVLTSLSDTPSLRGRGFLGRFLYAVPPSLAGTRMYENRPVDPDARRRYSRAIERILDLPDAGTEDDPSQRHTLLLTGEALSVWAKYHDAVEKRLAEGEDLCGIRDWASKLAGAVARIAGGFHLVENAGGDWQKPISMETVAAAWAVGEYLIQHALAAFGEMRADPRLVLARRILGWIERKALTEFTLRECQQAHKGSRALLTAEELQPALAVLTEHGYIRAAGSAQATGGRPSSASYAVNPGTHNANANM